MNNCDLQTILTMQRGGDWKIGMILSRKLKLGGVSFTARAYDEKGKPYHRTFRAKREAQCWLMNEKIKRRRGLSLMTPSKAIVADYFNYYLKNGTQHLQEGTLEEYHYIFKNHILPLFGNRKMRDIAFNDGILFQQTLTKKGLKNSTNNRILKFFKQVFNFAKSGKGTHKIIHQNPLEGIRSLPVVKKELNYWTSGEINEFLEKAKGEYYYDFYTIAINTGMRIGEIAALQMKKIDFANGIIIISNAIKNPKGGGTKLGTTKGKITRYFHMNQRVQEILKRLIRDKSGEEYVFTNRRGNPISPGGFTTQKFIPLQVRLGIKKPLRFHDLRHTYASNFVMSGGQLYSLQKILGHKKIETTQIYAHLHPSYMKNEANLVSF